MREILDLERFPIDQPGTPAYAKCVQTCRHELAETGMFNLDGFMKPEAVGADATELLPRVSSEAFHHARRHNIYFQKTVPGVAPDHPALQEFDTSNYTLCADQLAGTSVLAVYEYEPLRLFLAEVMGKPALYLMDDPLARLNVMQYGVGDALNWHFDRSEFTITLLLQKPDAGGVFEYRTGLRTAQEPNFDGVARFLAGEDPHVQHLSPETGTLNVFRGVNTAHRVTPVSGARSRLIAVLSYYDQPGRVFSDEERLGFYGRFT